MAGSGDPPRAGGLLILIHSPQPAHNFQIIMKNNHIDFHGSQAATPTPVAQNLSQSIPLAEKIFETTGDRSLLDFILLNTIVDEKYFEVSPCQSE